uniref:RWD domain-containing protein 1 n=1 Tax=Sparus aurata TaxID=8175 RepID=A0A671U1J7_SPAAU
MTDYAEEQRNELEAIESIYPDSFTVLSDDPTSFTITVTSDAGENCETVEATFKFTYVEKYPDEPPLWEINSQENLEESDVEDIHTLLQQQAEENLGMVMIFTLVTAVQEKLNEIVDVMKNRREEEKLRKEQEAEEAEKVAFQGTVVTIENFLLWKAKFEQEVAELRRRKQKEEEQAGKPKLTGKLCCCHTSPFHTAFSKRDYCLVTPACRLCEGYTGGMGRQFCSSSDHPVEVVTELQQK